MDPIHIIGGEVLANLDDRSITGLLIPFNEIGNTNVGRFQVEAGVIELPTDPSVITLNLDHDRFAPVGRATRVWEEPVGVMCSWAIAKTPAGDEALADALDPNGKRRAFSAEFRTGIKHGKATGGVLAAGALVERGAFPSASVLAADTSDDTTEAADDPTTTREVNEYTDEDGATWRRVVETETTEQATDTGTETTIVTTITEDETDQAEAAPTEQETEVTASQVVPATQRPQTPGVTSARATDPQAVFAAIADLLWNPMNRMNDAAPSHGVLAALGTLKFGGDAAIHSGGDVIRENWLGQLYQGIPYTRQYINLGNLGTNITAGGKAGYTLYRGTEEAPVGNFPGNWAGDGAALNGGVGFTKSHSSTLDRFAFGDKLAREFFDLPGGSEAVEAFFRLVLEDHLVWSDEKALATWVEVAGAPIAPKTYPGVDGHDYPDTMGMVVQGILAVKAKKDDKRRDVPTFVIANEIAYEELLYTPKELIPEFVTFNTGTDSTGTADGLTLVVGDTGVESTASVIVGAGASVDFDELPGGPLHIDALGIADGTVDKAIHGYLQTFKIRPEAVVHIGKADI